MNNALTRATAPQYINRGTAAPPTTLTAPQLAYQGRKKGALLCFGMLTLDGGPWDTKRVNTAYVPPRATFNAQNVNCDAWVFDLKAHGFDYAILTIQEESGFQLWPSNVRRDWAPVSIATGPGGAAFISPAFPDGPYGVRPGVADCNIVDKFVAACKKYGMAWGLYMNQIASVEQINGRWDASYSLLPATRIEEIVDYQCRLIQEVMLRYKPPVLWMDKGAVSWPDFSQRTYDAVKAIDPSCVYMGNHSGEANFSAGRFPYDGGVTEEFALPPLGTNTAYQTTTRPYLGTTYQIIQEGVVSPFVNSQWYDYTGARQQPAYQQLQYQPIATIQTTVNSLRAYNRPCLLAVLVTRTGLLLPGMLDYYDPLTFS